MSNDSKCVSQEQKEQQSVNMEGLSCSSPSKTFFYSMQYHHDLNFKNVQHKSVLVQLRSLCALKN